ncbi:MAG TPA: helix-turn-helix domain-containing protein [Draconibacterium sp.]|nr:helix-turn-helix domain-containing protein [Draconibacterium sp.]
MSKASQKWIEKGYEIFAVAGPDNFNIENLARQLQLNKSGFYHYFDDRESYFEELMKYHDHCGAEFAKELSGLKNFMPGYIQLLLKYTKEVQVQMQLRKNFKVPFCKEYYYKVKNRNNVYQIPLFAAYLNIKDLKLATEMFEIVSDLMVTRLITDKITMDFLTGIFEGMKITVEKLRIKT